MSKGMKRVIKTVAYCIITVLVITSNVTATELLTSSNQNNISLRINIDSSVFSSNTIRLNTEIYKISESVVNQNHLSKCFGDVNTNLFKSYKKYMNPLIPLALSLNESGSWADTRYTWSSAIYSRALSESGMDMSMVKVKQVDSDTYIVNELDKYIACGSNCTAQSSIGTKHTHIVGGYNDNDSLGSLQILRRYVEINDSINYKCGEQVIDLMAWRDSLSYFFHTQSSSFVEKKHWNKEHSIENVYELVAIMAVAHNTGDSFQKQSYAGSKWKDAKAVYSYCKFLGNEINVDKMKSYVDKWYIDILNKAKDNKQFSMAGQVDWSGSAIRSIMKDIGIDESKYTDDGSFGHKQVYPIKAILNYMALEKLYTSGNR